MVRYHILGGKDLISKYINLMQPCMFRRPLLAFELDALIIHTEGGATNAAEHIRMLTDGSGSTYFSGL